MNPLGDEAIAMLPEWWAKGPCVTPCVPQGDGWTVDEGDGGHFAFRPLDDAADGKDA